MYECTGILKNSNSYQHASPEARVSPTSERAPSNPTSDTPAERPSMPNRELSEKEIVQMNTELNAGGHRRTSSNPRGSMSRRQSNQSTTAAPEGLHDEQGMRLKWDEANLWTNEGQMGGKMKIDEPKTPYVGRYDADADVDEEDSAALNPSELAVDELEMKGPHAPGGAGSSKPRARESDIPGLDLGEPEMDPAVGRRESDGERKVMVESDGVGETAHAGHGEEREEDMSAAELEKHRKFEEMRKKHYEMKGVKGLLG